MILNLANGNLSTVLDFSIPTTLPEVGSINNISVFSSGGLDSGALLCLIMSELKATGQLDTLPVTCYTGIKYDGATYYASRLVSKIAEHFSCNIIHNNNVENDVVETGRFRFIASTEPNTVVYAGISRMVPESVKEFKNKLKVKYPNEFGKYKFPFLNMAKPQILDIYYKLGCEDIIQYTHSCVNLAVSKCNNCYSCEERAWAFTELMKSDTGTVPPDVVDISYNGTWQVS